MFVIPFYSPDEHFQFICSFAACEITRSRYPLLKRLWTNRSNYRLLHWLYGLAFLRSGVHMYHFIVQHFIRHDLHAISHVDRNAARGLIVRQPAGLLRHIAQVGFKFEFTQSTGPAKFRRKIVIKCTVHIDRKRACAWINIYVYIYWRVGGEGDDVEVEREVTCLARDKYERMKNSASGCFGRATPPS